MLAYQQRRFDGLAALGVGDGPVDLAKVVEPHQAVERETPTLEQPDESRNELLGHSVTLDDAPDFPAPLQGSTRYRDLVDLCHRYGISTHFSNILGFPDQDEEAILHHVRQLRAIRPFMASFYILTPIPGTDQYDDFLAGGLIRETNLDRFDATCSVWRHPRIESERLETHLYLAYREFYSARDVLTKMFRHRWNASYFVHALGVGYAAFARFTANRGMHPMAGGFGRVRIDTAADYLRFRRRVFGIDQLSLPASLSLSQATFIEAARATIPPSAAASQRWLLG